MSVYQSSKFASVMVFGKDWREVAKNALEKLEAIKAENPHYNFGFLYLTDVLAQDTSSILNLFTSVLNIQSWVGATGILVCGTKQHAFDKPAISVMIGHIKEDDFHLFEGPKAGKEFKAWLTQKFPMLAFVHASPESEIGPIAALSKLESDVQGFIAGGLSSSRPSPHFGYIHFTNILTREPLSGVVFSENVPVATTLSQGCTAIGAIHTITRHSGNSILELDDKRAVDVFEDDLRSMAIKKLDRDPDEILVDEDAIERGDIPEELETVFKGEVHAAFPVTGSDQNDYLVRNIVGLDPEAGSLAVNHIISSGDQIMFVQRSPHTVMQDLSASLNQLRARVMRDHGAFNPKGGIYISCIARAHGDESGMSGAQAELDLIHKIIGDIPLTGFYAAGEISKGKLYGYTGVLILFL